MQHFKFNYNSLFAWKFEIISNLIFKVVSNDENAIEYHSTCVKTMFFKIDITLFN
jgi:hypothetical protein